MKQKILKQLCMVFCLLTSMSAFAQTTAVVGCLKYSFEGNSAYIIGYDESTIPEDLVIPETVGYNGLTFNVTSIQFSAFSGCTKIVSLKTNHSLESIGKNAFSNCSNLSRIDVLSTSIGGSAFYNCDNLKKATINSQIIQASAFYSCS